MAAVGVTENQDRFVDPGAAGDRIGLVRLVVVVEDIEGRAALDVVGRDDAAESDPGEHRLHQHLVERVAGIGRDDRRYGFFQGAGIGAVDVEVACVGAGLGVVGPVLAGRARTDDQPDRPERRGDTAEDRGGIGPPFGDAEVEEVEDGGAAHQGLEPLQCLGLGAEREARPWAGLGPYPLRDRR